MEPSSPEGLVLRIDAKVCHVEVDGERRALPLAGKLFEERSHEKRPLAVGDRVRLDATGQAIDAVLPRQSRLHRRAASEGEPRAQVLAANITRVLVVTAAAEPPFQPDLVDGVLAAAAREDIPATLVVTKMDRDKKGRAQQWIDLYRGLGYHVLATSTAAGKETPATLAELAALLHQNRTVLCGLSGVGKSTLLNAVIPGLDLRVGSLNHIRQGRHTTTHTELIPLPGGGHVLDTPGIRSFHLFHAGAQEIQFLFPEIAARLPQCEYRNCLHRDGDPSCAVQRAVESGEIAESRYRSYAAMVAGAIEPPRPK
ncbi:MAG: ribosome small subunit-dependent GTPase A [Planctomycetota bacterium]